MDIYQLNEVVPLSYSRVRSFQKVSGLTVTVAVTNTKTNATLLASRSLSETATGSGEYYYAWTHSLVADTQCTVTYTVNGQNYLEYIFISGTGAQGRAY